MAADFFSADLRSERLVYFFPPLPLVGAALSYMKECAASGVVVVELDTRAAWWPLVARFERIVIGCKGETGVLYEPSGPGEWRAMALGADWVAIRVQF